MSPFFPTPAPPHLPPAPSTIPGLGSAPRAQARACEGSSDGGTGDPGCPRASRVSLAGRLVLANTQRGPNRQTVARTATAASRCPWARVRLSRWHLDGGRRRTPTGRGLLAGLCDLPRGHHDRTGRGQPGPTVPKMSHESLLAPRAPLPPTDEPLSSPSQSPSILPVSHVCRQHAHLRAPRPGVPSGPLGAAGRIQTRVSGRLARSPGPGAFFPRENLFLICDAFSTGSAVSELSVFPPPTPAWGDTNASWQGGRGEFSLLSKPVKGKNKSLFRCCACLYVRL